MVADRINHVNWPCAVRIRTIIYNEPISLRNGKLLIGTGQGDNLVFERECDVTPGSANRLKSAACSERDVERHAPPTKRLPNATSRPLECNDPTLSPWTDELDAALAAIDHTS